MRLDIEGGPDNWREKLLNGLSVRNIESYPHFGCVEDDAPLFAWLRSWLDELAAPGRSRGGVEAVPC
jgi:hypothetical protein